MSNGGFLVHRSHYGAKVNKISGISKDADNTLVICTTDNGVEKFGWPDGGTAPFRGEKNSNWEGGFRVSLMGRWPGVIEPGSRSNDIIAHNDWFPTIAEALVHPQAKFAHIMESRRGEAPTELEVHNSTNRRRIDGKITRRSVDFIERKAGGEQPFFLYIPYTQTHMPVDPSPEFNGITGNGNYADVLAQIDT